MSGPAAPVRPLPLIGLTPVAEEDMNRFKLIAEQLANAPFRECMLAQNLASGHPTSTVSNYMKGEDIIAHMVDSTDSASGLDKVKTEEEAIVLFERMLSAHLVAKPGSGKVVQAACPPLALRVHALRKEPSQADKDRALADLLRTNPHASMEDVVLPKGQQEKRDGLRVFFPTAENPRLSTKPDSHPLRLTPAAQYVLVHKKDMTNTLWMYLGGLAAVVLAATTFRLWPVFLQVGVWYISVTVLVVILGFYSIQLLIFGICWGFGFEVWVFPKMFDERYWWTEWFTEPLDARYVGGLWLLRACAIAALAVAVGWAVSQPEGTMEQMQDHSAQFFDELYSGKLLEGAAPTQFGRVGHIPTFDELQRLAEQEENDRETAAEDGAGSPVEGSANDSAEAGEQHGDKSEGSADEDESEGSANEDESEGSAEDEDGDEDDEQAALADAIMNAMAEGDDGEDEEEGAEASSDGDEE